MDLDHPSSISRTESYSRTHRLSSCENRRILVRRDDAEGRPVGLDPTRMGGDGPRPEVRPRPRKPSLFTEGAAMLTLVLTLTAAILALYYFARGRAVCPVRERLPLDQLDGTAVLGTISRGWAAPNIRRF